MNNMIQTVVVVVILLVLAYLIIVQLGFIDH